MANFLLEIGTKKLPADFIDSAIAPRINLSPVLFTLVYQTFVL